MKEVQCQNSVGCGVGEVTFVKLTMQTEWCINWEHLTECAKQGGFTDTNKIDIIQTSGTISEGFQSQRQVFTIFQGNISLQ